jgi:hypothetical protein
MVRLAHPATVVSALVVAALALVVGAADVARADLSLDAASATINVDGDSADWSFIDGVTVTLTQFDIPEGSDWDEPNALPDVDAVVKVATDDNNIYVLLEVPDDYDFVADDHNLSPSPSVMWLIDGAAGPHMGAGLDDMETGLGMVDIWHWELDCGPGTDIISGGGDAGSGNDPDCNMDDEYATDPEEREDDGGGDANTDAENSLAGAWDHSNRASGNGADGTWIFEFSRPLYTGDPEDAQFEAGGSAEMALAYFDADEGAEGWTDTGHLTSSDEGWIVVSLPGAAQPTDTATPGDVPDTGGSPAEGGEGTSSLYLLLAIVGLGALLSVTAVVWVLRVRRA